MGWDNPPVPWRELERSLSWGTSARRPADGGQAEGTEPCPVTRLPAAGRGSPAGEGPAWAELHCHSSYSFLDGASAPAELVAEAANRGLTALAITDHDGMYGVPQFAQAAARLKEQTGIGIGTIFGAELSLGLPAEGGAGHGAASRGPPRSARSGAVPPGGHPRTPGGPQPPGRVRPTRKASTCWCWPGTRRATGGCAR